MDEKPSYYAIIPAEVRYNKDLRANEKLLFGEITALSNTTGICTASNNYFANLYNVVPSAITKWIKDLEKHKYIEVEYIKKGKEIKQRNIRITGIHKYDEVFTNVLGGYSQKAKENNTSINTTSIKENIKRKVFKKPTIEEITQYCLERNNGINAEAFYDFYESKDWYVGKNRMKDWKACVRTWERRNEPKEEKLPSWFNKTNKDFEEEKDEEYAKLAEAIRNGTYKP
jgi:hypothetical protein